jgi:hypothetical protein
MYDVYIQGYKLNTEKISIAVACLTIFWLNFLPENR